MGDRIIFDAYDRYDDYWPDATDRHDALADEADRLASAGFYIDDYDPDDREPMGGDPLWAEDLDWP